MGASPEVTGAPGLLCCVQRIRGAECAGGRQSLSQAEHFRAGRSPCLFLVVIRAGGQGRLGLELGMGPRRASGTGCAEPLVSGGQNSRSGPCRAVAAWDRTESPGDCSPVSGVGLEGEEPHVEEAGVGVWETRGAGGDPRGRRDPGGRRRDPEGGRSRDVADSSRLHRLVRLPNTHREEMLR